MEAGLFAISGTFSAILKRKVFAYVTHRDRLLVYSHPDSREAGLQVPAGTLEDGEEPEVGVLREAREETGLTKLAVVSLLGEQQRVMFGFGKREIHHRYFYHLRYLEDPPDRWRHFELSSSQGGKEPILFQLFCLRLPDEVAALIADHGCYLAVQLGRDTSVQCRFGPE